jgi:hypothetical protein
MEAKENGVRLQSWQPIIAVAGLVVGLSAMQSGCIERAWCGNMDNAHRGTFRVFTAYRFDRILSRLISTRVWPN